MKSFYRFWAIVIFFFARYEIFPNFVMATIILSVHLCKK